MDDITMLTDRNRRFIDACRRGSWTMLEPLLSGSFSYLDGATGEVWELDRYVQDLTGNPQPGLTIDQVVIHVDGDTAVVSARSRPRAGHYHRYLDSYRRRGDDWVCVHACVWPLAGGG
jgi:Domain of unknown function (DUF4440)